jgi:hypothetical protein
LSFHAEKAQRGWVLVHDEQTYPVARRIVEELIGGASLSAVAGRLNEDGVPTAKYGKCWRPQSIYTIASSRTQNHV